jgi:energy-coupling factor transporter ATP-binding protein EcfA2
MFINYHVNNLSHVNKATVIDLNQQRGIKGISGGERRRLAFACEVNILKLLLECCKKKAF